MSILNLENENLVIKSNNRVLLKNINLTVENGDKILFCGINGSGKSTLFKALYNFVCIDGDSYAELRDGKYTFCDSTNLEDLNQKIIYISQEDFISPNPFSRVEKCLLNGIPSEVANKKKFLADWIEKYKPFTQDDNDKKLLKKRISSLSGGEKKYIAIIQSLLRCDSESVRLLLIDEPVNNLDAHHVRHLSDLLTRISHLSKINDEKGFAMIIISHCHAFSNITKAFEIKDQKMEQIDYSIHNCFGSIDKDGYYQKEMNPEVY